MARILVLVERKSDIPSSINVKAQDGTFIVLVAVKDQDAIIHDLVVRSNLVSKGKGSEASEMVYGGGFGKESIEFNGSSLMSNYEANTNPYHMSYREAMDVDFSSSLSEQEMCGLFLITKVKEKNNLISANTPNRDHQVDLRTFNRLEEANSPRKPIRPKRSNILDLYVEDSVLGPFMDIEAPLSICGPMTIKNQSKTKKKKKIRDLYGKVPCLNPSVKGKKSFKTGVV
ncbi:hypothetical protein DITRI_Ditri16bG0066000 [Diplodiscus trichospermus]